MAAEGLTTIESRFGPKETLDRLEDDVKAKGLPVFARIDHAAGAAAVEISGETATPVGNLSAALRGLTTKAAGAG